MLSAPAAFRSRSSSSSRTPRTSRGAASATAFNGLFWWLTQASIAAAAAFSPNPATEPFYADFPVDGDGNLRPEIWERWLAHDPLSLLDTHADAFRRVRFAFDVGDSDDLVAGNQIFARALTDLGIDHTFETYPGDHFSGIGGRVRNQVLPFMDEHLLHSMKPTAVQPVSAAGVKIRHDAVGAGR